MIYKLKIKCFGGMYFWKACVRVITLEDADTLLDLHQAIQEAVSFDHDHLFEFYTANSGSPFAAKHRFFEDARDWEEECEGYAAMRLRDIWPLGSKKLYYHFDFGADWIFEIRKLRSLKSDADLKPGQVLESEGPNPVQYPTEEEWASSCQSPMENASKSDCPGSRPKTGKTRPLNP